ncbi:small nuclear ribonucleoprotein Lsm8, putative [Trichophyton verrucosum HKI 0517]|uniref:U6 snRNA-associated Sm-like protein LSm1 n=1 Tax=Trichophyton verrucosum (strain HKI 0517) TaxID=663202 RepID=D4D886_TRIVH|nr:small nuclear ribonucleoprotein Lsm8, putative [Trichophyton verrucosum HKI 0517]EFE41942.1 small nuclear ribonucleoprotein Lsm8, putative [Trichophyton verrucosum HKI 0517]
MENFPTLEQAARGRQGDPMRHPQGGGHHGPSPPSNPQQQQPQQLQQPQIPPASAIPLLEPQGPPQLPPQLFTTAAQLLDLTDKKLVLVLRDGRKLIGVLRSWDQFANIVLQDTIERLYAENLYADIPRGVFLVRGENVLLLGEIVRQCPCKDTSLQPLIMSPMQDLDKDDDIPEPYRQAPASEVLKLKKQAEERRKRKDKRRSTHLQALGFEPEHSGEILF